MEPYESKYYNLDRMGDKWTREEVTPVLSFLESASLETLQKLVTECGVRFQGGNENVRDEETLIVALIGHDVTKEVLLEKLKTLI